jgi:hypothetical protein
MTPPRRPLAAVYAEGMEGDAWSIGETVAEALELVRTAEEAYGASGWVTFTIAGVDREDLEPDASRWDGRPVHVRAGRIVAIGPPLAPND